MSTKIIITRGLQFHPQTQRHEVDIPDDAKTTIADLRAILIERDVMRPEDLFILPSSKSNLESASVSPSSSNEAPVEPAVLVKVDENRNDWTMLKKADESISVLEAPPHLQNNPEPPLTGRIRGNGSNFAERLLNAGAQAVQAGSQLLQHNSLNSQPSQNSQILQTSHSVQPSEDLFQVANMNNDEWDRVFDINKVFHGIRMGVRSETEDHGPERSGFSLIEARQDVIPNRIAANGIDTEERTVCSERNHKYLRAGWTNAAIDVTTPYASASVEARHTESHSQEVADKTTYTTKLRMYQQVRLEFDLKAVKANLSPRFMSDLEEALNQATDIKKRQALLHLFEHYGHVFATRVTLGGSIISSDIQTVQDREQSDSKKNEGSISLGAQIFGAKVGGGSNKENTSKRHDDDARQSTKILGGNQTYAPKKDEEPSEKWVNSIQKNFEFWQIIRTDGVVPITSLLPDQYQEQVLRLSPVIKPLWGYLADVELVGRHGVDFYKPVIPTKSGPWYFLGHSLDNGRALVIKERFTGSLCEIQDLKSVWNDKSSLSVEHFANLTPSTPNYIAIGSLYYSSRRFSNTQSKSSLYARIRAIKSSLLQPIDYDDQSVHTHKKVLGTNGGSIWKTSHNLDGFIFDLMHASATTGKPNRTAYTIDPEKIEMIGIVDQTPAFDKNMALPTVPISLHAPTVSDAASATAASGTSAAASRFTTPSATPHMSPMNPLIPTTHEGTSSNSAHTARPSSPPAPPTPTDTVSIHTQGQASLQPSPFSGQPNLSDSGPASASGSPLQTVPPSFLFGTDHPTN